MKLLTPDNTQVYIGGSVKALGDGRVGGYLVLFSSANDPDISDAKDFFTKSTDFDLDRSNVCTVLFEHGRDPVLKSRKLGQGTMVKDEVGIWFDAKLNMRDAYEKAVYALAEAGALGWSSGTASHLVARKEAANSSHEVTAWPLGLDATLTPCPAEPRLSAMPLKSLPAIKTLADLVAEFEIELDAVDASKSIEIKAKWSAEFVNNLPDSSFAYIADGGELDDEGKTAPRKLRMFPYKDGDGKADASHVKSALARIPTSTKLSDSAKKKALKTVEKAAKKLGIEVADDPKSAFKGVYLDELERRYRCIYALIDVLETCLYRLDYAEDLADDYGISIDVPAAIHELFVECEAEIQGYFAEDADDDSEKSLSLDLAIPVAVAPFAKHVAFVAAVMRENTKRMAAVESEIEALTARAEKESEVPAALRGEILDARSGLEKMLATMKSTGEKLAAFAYSVDPQKAINESKCDEALLHYRLVEGGIANQLSDVPS